MVFSVSSAEKSEFGVALHLQGKSGRTNGLEPFSRSCGGDIRYGKGEFFICSSKALTPVPGL